MAQQQTVSGILAKLGSRFQEAFEKHKTDETELGNIDLPSGIRGGIAEVTSVGFGIFKEGTKLAGQPYFMAAGVVREPKEFVDSSKRFHRTEGRRTSVGPEPLCDTPDRLSRKTFNEHVAWVLNELRKLGVKTATLPKNINLEQLCKALVNPKKPIYVYFDTFGGPTVEDPNARINHKWLGPADPSQIGANAANVQEAPTDALPKPTRNGHTGTGAGTTTPTATRATGRKPAAVPQPEPEPTTEESFEEGGDIDSLAEAALAGDNKAASELAEQAIALGFTEEQINQAPDWGALRDAMKSGQDPSEVVWETGEDDNTQGADEFPPPIQGEIYLYKPVDPKTKKPATKAVECEVLTVDEEAQTVQLKNMVNPKLRYNGVAWSALEASSTE